MIASRTAMPLVNADGPIVIMRRTPLSVLSADALASAGSLRTDSVSRRTSMPKKLSTSASVSSSMPAAWLETTIASRVAASTIPSCGCGMPAWKTATACAVIGPNFPSDTAATVSWIARTALELKRLAAATAAFSCAGVSGPGARARTRVATARCRSPASGSSAVAPRWSTVDVPDA